MHATPIENVAFGGPKQRCIWTPGDPDELCSSHRPSPLIPHRHTFSTLRNTGGFDITLHIGGEDLLQILDEDGIPKALLYGKLIRISLLGPVL